MKITKFITAVLILCLIANLNAQNTATEDEGVIINGVKWATRNLDIGSTFVANPEDHGALFQWGRGADGHENRNSATTTMLSTNDTPGHCCFILVPGGNWDWRSSLNNALWNAGTTTAPVKATNDPCPNGWRVPTRTELNALNSAGSVWTNQNGVSGRRFGSGDNTLFLPASGHRSTINEEVLNVGTRGSYWCSTVNGTNVHSLTFLDTTVYPTYYYGRATAISVRCVEAPFTSNLSGVENSFQDCICCAEALPSNLSETEITKEKKPIAFYNTMGIKLKNAPESGIYIIMYDNGTAEKVVK